MPEAFAYSSIDKDFVLSLPFVNFADREQIPDKPGIYIIYQTSPKLEMLYVGKSTSLRTRLSSKHNLNGFLAFLNYLGNELKVAYLEVEEGSGLEDDLSLNEIVIIHKLQPLINVDYNPKRPIFMKPLQIERFGYDINGEVQERNQQGERRGSKPKIERLAPEILEVEAEAILSKIDTMTIRQLKLVAMKVGVIGYSCMTKRELIVAIELLLKTSKSSPKTKEKSGLYAVG